MNRTQKRPIRSSAAVSVQVQILDSRPTGALNGWNSGGYQHENYGHVRLGGGRGEWHAEERLGSPFGPHLYMHAPQLAQVSSFHSPGKDAPMWSLNRL